MTSILASRRNRTPFITHRPDFIFNFRGASLTDRKNLQILWLKIFKSYISCEDVYRVFKNAKKQAGKKRSNVIHCSKVRRQELEI